MVLHRRNYSDQFRSNFFANTLTHNIYTVLEKINWDSYFSPYFYSLYKQRHINSIFTVFTVFTVFTIFLQSLQTKTHKINSGFS